MDQLPSILHQLSSQYQQTITLQQELAQQHQSTLQQLKRIEDEQKSCQERIQGQGKAEEAAMYGALRSAADALAVRSDTFYSQKSGLLDQKVKTEDERIIAVYDNNKDIPAIATSLQSQYDAAMQRKEERDAFSRTCEQPMTAGIVLRDQPTGLELYLSIPAARQEEGLMRNLVEAVGNALLLSHSQLKQHDEVQGILRLLVQSSGEDLVALLSQQQPDDFASAHVQYKVVTLLPAAADQKKLEQKVVQKIPRDDGQPSLGKHIREVIGAVDYIFIKDSPAYTGMHPTSVYKYLDMKGGSIATRKNGKLREVHLESLLVLAEQKHGLLTAYSYDDAASLWKQQYEKWLQTTVEKSSCTEFLRLSEEHGDITSFLGKDEQKYFCKNEFSRFAVNYFSQKALNQWPENTISRTSLGELLDLSNQRMRILVREKKIMAASDKERITLDSVRQFRDQHEYDGKKWSPVEIKRHRKEQITES